MYLGISGVEVCLPLSCRSQSEDYIYKPVPLSKEQTANTQLKTSEILQTQHNRSSETRCVLSLALNGVKQKERTVKDELHEFTFKGTETFFEGKTPERKTQVSFKKHCNEVEAKGLVQLWKHGSMVKTKMDANWSELLLLKGRESQIKCAALLHEVRIHEV